MSEIRKLAGQAECIETGAVQFGDDWPGVFIRGDNAMAFALYVEMELGGKAGPMEWAALRGLRDLLRSCDVRRRQHD